MMVCSLGMLAISQQGIADQRRQLVELLKGNVRKRWRKAVTGDESKRVRDHIR